MVTSTCAANGQLVTLPSCSCSYEIMSPETIGLQRHDEAGIVLGKHSGR